MDDDGFRRSMDGYAGWLSVIVMLYPMDLYLFKFFLFKSNLEVLSPILGQMGSSAAFDTPHNWRYLTMVVTGLVIQGKEDSLIC